MNTVDFLEYLHNLDVKVSVDGERLRVNAPQGTLTPELRAELEKRKDEILTFLCQPHLKGDVSQESLRPVSREGDIPLSFAQERLWFLNQLEPESSAYNMASAYCLKGPLDVGALEKSFNDIVARHETLRTTFRTEKGQPVQVIAPKLTLRIPVIELSIPSEDEQEAEIKRLMREERSWIFELEEGPLIRTRLVQLKDEEHVLLMTMHHIISDAWSIDILYEELGRIYEAKLRGKEAELPELAIQYADYAVWQRKWLEGEELRKQLDYWKKQLEGAPPTIELPTDRPRPAVQTFRGMSQTKVLSKTLSEELKRLSLEQEATLFMMLLAAFKALLYRYTEQEDIVVGIPIANRNRSEIEKLIGFFINTLVLRTELSDNPTFRELLGRVREEAIGAYDHQDLPFEKLVEELHPQRDLSRSPLFQVFFNMLNRDQNQLELTGVTIEPITQSETNSKFDLTLYAREQKNEGIHFKLEYNTDIFDATTIDRLLGHYETLLEGIVAEPETRLAELPLLTAAERDQLVAQWNETSREYPKDKSIQELFERQVERTPEATAIIFGEEALSYQELNMKANQVAHHLKKQRVGKEVLVGICLERSLEMVVGLLGILKAGGAYLPLDPNYPAERLAFMLEDAQAPVLLTQEKLVDKIGGHQAETVCIDSEWNQIQQESEENPQSGITGENLAYAIYTSGSTGKPKGVLGLHQGAINRFAWMWERYPFEAGEVCCQKTTLNFVDSIWEIFGPLLRGVPIVIIPDEAVKDPNGLIEALAKYEISRIVLVPSLLRAMLETNQELGSKLSRLKTWVTSGEAIPKELTERFQAEMGPSSRLINLYGSSEVSADVTYYEIGAMGENERSIPIGRPIANTQIYLLDKEMKPVPIGVGGEIYVGGEGLARGYLNRAELTKEKFVSNPYRAGERLYRTGDIGRHRGDGQIEYVGRVDHQVKIRGFRIELGEIEAVLGQHPKLHEGIINVWEDTPGDKRLIAYFVPKPGQSPATNDLRNFLKKRLPDYMIPSIFMMLAQLPLTANGKVDRRSLPEPDHTRHAPQESYLAPRNDLELQLTKIWENVLNVQPIGVQDNFFDLGGHSLLAVRLFAEIEQCFGKNLPLASLFREATIEHLASLLTAQDDLTTWSSLVELQPQGSKPPFFCVHGLTGDVLWFAELARCVAPDQPFYGLQARGLDGIQEPFTEIEALAAYYIKEMRTLQPDGPYFLGGASFGGTVALEIARQLQLEGQKVALLAIFDHAPPNIHDNADDSKFVWALRSVIKSLYNFPYWLKSFRQLSAGERIARIRRKANVTKKGLSGRFTRLNGESDQIKAADIIDYASELPEYRQKLIEAHYQAIKNYIPQTYSGQVTLFRARSQPAFSGRDAELGWKKLATGGVEVKMVSGSHEGMFKEPYVQVLAESLKLSLNKAQANSDSIINSESDLITTVE